MLTFLDFLAKIKHSLYEKINLSERYSLPIWSSKADGKKINHWCRNCWLFILNINYCYLKKINYFFIYCCWCYWLYFLKEITYFKVSLSIFFPSFSPSLSLTFCLHFPNTFQLENKLQLPTINWSKWLVS